jgi:hypothetical protein
LHRFRDSIYKTGMEIAIPIALKLKLTPNQITVLRFLIIVPPAALLFAYNNYFGNILALILYHLFVFLDVLDGKIAFIRNMCTRLGQIIDPPIDYIGHNIIFIGIIFGIIGSNGVFNMFTFLVQIPTQLLIFCGLLTLIGFSVPIIFCIQPPTPFFMIRDLHDLHEEFFPEKKIKMDSEPMRIWLPKNIVCPYNFPFSILFKIGPLLTLCVLFNLLPFSLIIFAITLNIRTLTMYYYFFKI